MSYILRPVCAGLLYLFALNAIQAQFVFSYDGPDTLFVGADCTVPLNWGHPETPDVFPTLPGQVIVSWKIYSISGGYMIDDPVPAGQTVTIFYEVRDNMGHISLFGFNLPVVDRLAPVFDPASLPDDVTVSCAGEVPVADITYSDNCSDPNEIQLIYQDGGNAPICIGGVVNRSWTITDGAGNSAVFVQHITVVTDTTAPVITVIPENGMARMMHILPGSRRSAQTLLRRISDAGFPV